MWALVWAHSVIIWTPQSLSLLSLHLSLPSYLQEGFLHLQQLVGQAIIQWQANEIGVPFEPVDVSVRVSVHDQ